jgi:hypothetical protein
LWFLADVIIGKQHVRQEQTTTLRVEVKERARSVADGDNESPARTHDRHPQMKHFPHGPPLRRPHPVDRR